MAWRLRLAPEKTHIDFFRWQYVTFGGSMILMLLAFLFWGTMGLNFGIDFKGGTTIRTQSVTPVNTGLYRHTLEALHVGDISVTQVFDPSFGPNQHVASVRIGAKKNEDQVSENTVKTVETALKKMDPKIKFTSVDSIGPKVSAELVQSSFIAVGLTSLGIAIYIWMRFEWQFALGGVLALLHDVFITVGLFALFQWRFDLTIVAALLTILGYSINDTVVVFDRLRENLIKYKTMPLKDVMNLSVNETLSRTLATSLTTLIAVGSLLALGGDVIRGFSLAIFIGIILGTYSSVYVAKNLVLFLGLDRSDKPKKSGKGPDHEFANIDA